ncbi:MAG TPA: DUF2148 domain-containing protein [Selenomonadales bacterium]|nr:DUF2148 domain-containing protein [Selenomonadales bacterium]
MITKSQEIEERTVERIADLMCVAARTAPKGRGVDNLVTMIVKAREKDQLAEEMRRVARTSGAQFFERDAGCLDKAAVVVLFGQKVSPLGVTPCGYCGYANCAECSKHNGLCAICTGDLGIAIGSAVSVAALHRADNRIMFSVGKAALNLDLFEEDVRLAYGVPLSVSGKSPFFDR